MRARLDCVPCYFKQALTSAAYVDASEKKQLEVMHEIARILPQLKIDASPAHNSTIALRAANRILGVDDPYLNAKIHYNNLVLDLYPELKRIVDESPAPLETAAKLSVVGNVIDLGIRAEIDIDATQRQVFDKGFTKNHLPNLIKLLEKPRKVLYMVDNAGEIVFDKIFVEQLIGHGHTVIVGVKSGPILNDCTIEDACQVEMDKITEVVETGSNWIGTDLETCSDEFRELYFSADFVIAKGQANYETIEGSRDNLFMILKAKCESVADNAGVKFGDLIFLESTSTS